jgi:DMSO reductase anchor subunit
MHSSEWSLLFFTLIGQFSAGVATVLLLYSLLFRNQPNAYALAFIRKALLISTITILVALVISFIHLSAPLSSVFALSNLKGSWLSREILMVSVYAAAVFATTAYWLWLKEKGIYIRPLLLLSSALGLGMVYTMGKLYMIPTVPVWNTPATLIAFYSNTIILGFSFILMLMHYSLKNEAIEKIEKIFLFIMIMVLAVKVISGAINWVGDIEENVGFARRNIHGIWYALSWCWLPGLALIIRKAFPKPNEKPSVKNLYLIAFVFFLIAEFAARVIFYSSYFRVGV